MGENCRAPERRRKPATLAVQAIAPRLETLSKKESTGNPPALRDVARVKVNSRNRFPFMQTGEDSRIIICVLSRSEIRHSTPLSELTWTADTALTGVSASNRKLDLRIRYSYVLAV